MNPNSDAGSAKRGKTTITTMTEEAKLARDEFTACNELASDVSTVSMS